MEKISKGTIARTAVLAVAIVNGLLAMFGKSPLPFDEAMIEDVISYGAIMVTGVVAWWKDNDFTSKARTRKATAKAIEEGRLNVVDIMKEVK